MKIRKTDQRSKFTQMIIKKNLLKLLSEKPLNKIAVSELCLKAQVNRGTFYNHFYDVFDVYESIENEFFLEIQNKLNNIKVYAVSDVFFKELMTFISENSDFMSVIAADFGENSLLKKLVTFIRGKYVSEFSEQYPHIREELFQTIFTYILNGSIGILMEWIKQDKRESPDKIAQYISRFSSLIVEGYLKDLDSKFK